MKKKEKPKSVKGASKVNKTAEKKNSSTTKSVTVKATLQKASPNSSQKKAVKVLETKKSSPKQNLTSQSNKSKQLDKKAVDKVVAKSKTPISISSKKTEPSKAEMKKLETKGSAKKVVKASAKSTENKKNLEVEKKYSLGKTALDKKQSTKKTEKDVKAPKPKEQAKPVKTEEKNTSPKKVSKTQKNEEKALKAVSKLSIKKQNIADLNKKSKKKGEPDELAGEADPFLDDLTSDLSADLDDDFTSDLLEITPAKRRPGRPPKQKDLQGQSIVVLPPTLIRLPKKEPSKPRKPLSDTLPGTSLAALLASTNDDQDLTTSKEGYSILKEENKLKGHLSNTTSLLDLSNDLDIALEADDDSQATPSWVPRNWVTREGERLIIRGNELLKEKQFGPLHAESTYGVISPDQVDDVIRKIRESYKKKNVPKKITG